MNKIYTIIITLLLLVNNSLIASMPVRVNDRIRQTNSPYNTLQKPFLDPSAIETFSKATLIKKESNKTDQNIKPETIEDPYSKPAYVPVLLTPEDDPLEETENEDISEDENPYIFDGGGELPEGLIIPDGYELEYIDVHPNGLIIEIGFVAIAESDEDASDILEGFDFGIYVLREYMIDTDGIVHFSVLPKDMELWRTGIIEIDRTDLFVDAIKQDYKNCGPVALATVLNYYGENIDPNNQFVRYTYAFGVDINSLVEEAENMGYDARVVNNGSLEDLALLIDAGIPVITLGKGSGEHYVVVMGYERNEDGEITTIRYNSWGREYTMTAEEFSEWWAASMTGNNVYIAIAPKDSELAENLPSDNLSTLISSGLDIAEGASDIGYGLLGAVWPFADRSSKFIGVDNWAGNIVSAPFKVAGGLVRLLGGAIGKLFSFIGSKTDGKFGNFMTTIGTGVNNACNWVADGFEAASNFVSNTVSTVVDTVVDVVDTVVETVGNFFRGLFGG